MSFSALKLQSIESKIMLVVLIKGGGGLVTRSCLTLVTPWNDACQVPLSIGFSRQEYWNGLLCPPPWDLPNLGIKPSSLVSPALAGGFLISRATQEAHVLPYH